MLQEVFISKVVLVEVYPNLPDYIKIGDAKNRIEVYPNLPDYIKIGNAKN